MIRIGDVIKLRPSIFEREFSSPQCEWLNKYMYEDQFELVSLWFGSMGQNGDIARTIFGSSESIINQIEYLENGQPFEVITDVFRIILPAALEKNELTVTSYDKKTFRPCKADKDLNEDLEFFEKEYLNGMFSIMERENNKMDMYKLGFYLMKREGKWKNAC